MSKLDEALALIHSHVAEEKSKTDRIVAMLEEQVNTCLREAACAKHDKEVSSAANKRKTQEVKALRKNLERALLIIMSDKREREDTLWARGVYMKREF